MEEARRVLARLERIEALRAADTPADALLAEVRALVGEAEAWLAVEGGDVERARAALERCRAAIGEPAFL